jgi:hypothetical protein
VVKGTVSEYSVCVLRFNLTDILHRIFNHLPSILFSLHTDNLTTDEGTARTVLKVCKAKSVSSITTVSIN